MKFLITGDWHITDKAPENRTDDYFQTQFNKIEWIINLAIEEDCILILQPGDMLASHRANDFLKQYYIEFMRGASSGGTVIATVFGQHDLRWHSSNIENTPLMVMYKAEAVLLLKDKPFVYPEGGPFIYGASWNEEIPDIIRTESGEKAQGIHVLVTHRMVINEKLWPGQEAQGGKALLANYDFDVMVTGDNHTSFTSEYNSRHLVNCGSLMRSNIDQADHKPVVYIFDTKTRELTRHYIPVEPFEQVINMQKAEEKKEKDSRLKSFIEKVKENVAKAKEKGILNFPANLRNYVSANEVRKGVREVLKEATDGLK